ncbi:hypothetical protein [Paraburkholderia rhynchosiae]|uniref:Uncharacterized protein n=1 Tax=Paraburkholderia rhynchosiae TaxID=487049 RepID=A0A2N7WWB4_9BURK|nr:hypothetical protein [Paraburkholderia rhynchosiae]PMS33786.1 hypothetical protein C0Z16_04465 [Paraburkholderia rhynchosiae]CAB3668838.1 hypothetical protein LMG27174_02039 [Paraburkholderia rhynchosiae]
MTDTSPTNQPLPPYLVGYSLDHTHRVVVGIRAASAEAACVIARAAFDAGTLWDDAPNMPLLYDDYEELDGQVLSFDATGVTAWPPADVSVRAVRLHAAAHQLLAFARLVDERSPQPATIEAWHPEALVSMTLTAGQVRQLRALLGTLTGC